MTLTGDKRQATPEPPPEGNIPRRPLAESGGLARLLDTAGDMVRFVLGVFADLRFTLRFPAEIFRQAGILIVSSGLVIWFMELVIGAVVGLEGHYLLRQLGASGYVGLFTAIGDIRVGAPEMWGWILSAKVGCGLVAEIGSMRINEEIDALEVMGVHPRPYLVGTRLVASWIATPFLYLVGLGVMYISSYLVVVPMLGSVSSGGYFDVFWGFQRPTDLLWSLIWVMVMGTVIVLIGCYYGYTAKGGPVGVGRNTAKSMMLNMIIVSIVGLLMYQLFWGATAHAPISN